MIFDVASCCGMRGGDGEESWRLMDVGRHLSERVKWIVGEGPMLGQGCCKSQLGKSWHKLVGVCLL